MKRRTRSAGTGELFGGPGFTPRQVTALALGLLLAMILVPVGAQAAQVVSAIITDPGGVNQATVDSAGNLHVAVTGTTIPGYEIVVEGVQVPGNGGGAGTVASCPEGKKVLGGGFSGPNVGLEFYESAPDIEADGTAWFVGVTNPSPNDVFVNIYAVCATVF